MKKVLVLLSCVFLLCVACQPLQRGIQAGAVASSRDPAVRVDVSGLPLKTAGFAMASLDGTSAVAGLPVDVWLAVYGADDAASPMAIVAHAVVPDGWQWDHDSTPPFSEHTGAAVINGMGFQTCTYIADGRRDAFATLVGQERESARWLVRRFAARSSFGREKLTLEYREPLPAATKVLRVADLPFMKQTRAFEKRAESVFSCVPYDASRGMDAKPVLQHIDVRYLGKNFLGGASTHELRDALRR